MVCPAENTWNIEQLELLLSRKGKKKSKSSGALCFHLLLTPLTSLHRSEWRQMEFQYVAQELLSRNTLLMYTPLLGSLNDCHLRKSWPNNCILLLKDWGPKFVLKVALSSSKHPLQTLSVPGKPCVHGQKRTLPLFAWISAVLPGCAGQVQWGLFPPPSQNRGSWLCFYIYHLSTWPCIFPLLRAVSAFPALAFMLHLRKYFWYF